MKLMTLEEWRDQGRTRTQLEAALRDGSLVRLRRGVVAELDEATRTAVHRMKIEAAAPFLGPDTYFAHESAAVLHGLPLLARRLDEVVAVRTGGGHGTITRTLHARRAQVSSGDATQVDGLPVTSLFRTTCDLTRRLPFPEAVMVADAALRSGLDRGELLRRVVGGRGCRMAAAALEFADARSESPGESLSRVRIHRAGLPAPIPQTELFDDFGNLVARVDFWWEGGVVGEFDGMVKYGALLRPGQTLEDVIDAEKFREQALVAAGCRVIRWTWRDLWNGQLEHRLRHALDPSGPSTTPRASLGVHSQPPGCGPRQ
ncbi:MAG TPA: hypothetical protein VGK53_03680 [Propionicimonas sp.]